MAKGYIGTVHKKINTSFLQNIFHLCTILRGLVESVQVIFSVSSPAAGGDSLIIASPAPGASGLQGFLVPSFVKPLDVVVASKEAVARLQFTSQQVQEVSGEMAPPVVDLAHDYVSGPKLDVRTGLAALVRIQDQKANFEEEAVWSHVETTHLVKTITAHHQCDEADSFTQHINVVDDAIHSKLTVAVILSLLLLLSAFTHAEGIVREVRFSPQDIKLVKQAGGSPVEDGRMAAAVPGSCTNIRAIETGLPRPVLFWIHPSTGAIFA